MPIHPHNLPLLSLLPPRDPHPDRHIPHRIINRKHSRPILPQTRHKPKQIRRIGPPRQHMHTWPNRHHKLILTRILTSLLLHKLTIQWPPLTKYIIIKYIYLLFIRYLWYNFRYFYRLLFCCCYVEVIVLGFVAEEFELGELTDFLFELLDAGVVVAVF